jgi:hypothetical protein
MLWALGRLAWGLAGRAGRAIRRAARGLGPEADARASGDWLGARGYTPAAEEEIRRIARILRETYCEECKAVDHPQGRCPKCREKLGRLLEKERGAA